MRISDWSSDVCSSDLIHACAPIGIAMEVEHLHALLVIPFLTLCLIGKAVGIDGNQWAISQRRQCAESTLDIVCVKGNDQINVHRVPDIDRKSTRLNSSH